jgi:DNA-directed RNA polymerase II subunit RPB1
LYIKKNLIAFDTKTKKKPNKGGFDHSSVLMSMREHGDLIGLQFGLLGDLEIERSSVARVFESTLHTRNQPKANGPIDQRFGTSSRFELCATCKQAIGPCSGHHGHVVLPLPLPHIAYQSNRTLGRYLNIICINCSAFLPGPDFRFTKQAFKDRLKEAYNDMTRQRARKTDVLCCHECGLLQPTLSIDGPFVSASWNEAAVQNFFQPDEHGRVHLSQEAEETTTTTALGKEEEKQQQLQMWYDYFVKKPMTNWDARDMLESVTTDTLTALNVKAEESHPSRMMLHHVVAIPLCNRPTTSSEENSKRKGYDDLTKKLVEIAKHCRGAEAHARDAGVDLRDEHLVINAHKELSLSIKNLYLAVSDMMYKDKAKVPGYKFTLYQQRARAGHVSIADRWRRKEGRFRGALMGKRVDYSARTVITPGANMCIDEIGLPERMAAKLSRPFPVTDFNRNTLQKLLRAGKINRIRNPSTGARIYVSAENRNTIALQPGWIVDRQLIDNDVVIINRQPTLHRPSVMGHRVRVVPGRTMMLPMETTTPYNADFDGDEMNVHAVQTLESYVEVKDLMNVTNHIIHPRANRPIMGEIQDPIDSAYKLTRQDTFLTKGEFCQLLMQLKYDCDAPTEAKMHAPEADLHHYKLPVPAILKPVPLWTGKQLVSCVIPRITIHARPLKRRDPLPDRSAVEPAALRRRLEREDANTAQDGFLDIRDGQLLRGTLCSQNIGPVGNSMLHDICTYMGNNTAGRFMSDLQRLLNHYIHDAGLTFSIRDCILPLVDQKRVQAVYKAVHRHVDFINDIRDQYPDDERVQELAETNISESLGKVLTLNGQIACQSKDDRSGFFIMSYRAKSKGSEFNMGQVLTGPGQQYVNGARPLVTAPNRSLPSDPLPGQPRLPIEDRLIAEGLVQSPYIKGLTPREAMMHAQGGREGLVDTAVKTGKSFLFSFFLFGLTDLY